MNPIINNASVFIFCDYYVFNIGNNPTTTIITINTHQFINTRVGYMGGSPSELSEELVT